MRRALVVIGLALALTGTAWADGVHQHDGFAARLSVGGGFVWSTESAQGMTMNISGGSVLLSFAFGYAVLENLIVDFDMFGAGVVSPRFQEGGRTSTPSDASVTHAACGPGVTYYVMPLNLYVAASVGLARSQLDIQGMSFHSGSGVGVNVLLGKEWWIAGDWGLGLAAQIMYMNVPDETRLNTLGGGVLLSATYN